MPQEIERKFLVTSDIWRLQSTCATRIAQGYLADDPRVTVRVRIAGETAYLTIKGETRGITRSELEYPIPLADAELMLRELCVTPAIEKVRHRVPVGGHLWEVDVFGGTNTGLVIAEIELSAEEEPFERPTWIGAEVSGDPRYYNACLARRPYGTW